MKPPSSSDYVLGHGATVTALGCVTYFLAMRWFTEADYNRAPSWIVVGVALLTVKAAASARKRVKAFKAWQGDWDKMADEQPVQATAPSRKPRRVWRAVLGIAVWLLMVFWLSAHALEPMTGTYEAVTTGFLLTSLWGIGAGILGLARRFRSRAPAERAQSSHVVSVCVRAPRSSPRPADMIPALPAYARALLARGTAAAPR